MLDLWHSQNLHASKICTYVVDDDCSIRVYQSFVAIFQNISYAQNYAGTISWSLPTICTTRWLATQ